MRFLGLFLFLMLVAVGCNADPRCRRETALLRAEILDLEDKLAFATAGSYYDGGVLSSSGEVIISDSFVDSGSPQIIYESEIPYSSNTTLSAPAELEVQHQIFPESSPAFTPEPTQLLDVEDLNIEIDSPQLPENLKLPANKGSKIQRPRKQRRRRSSPETEMTIDDSPIDLEIDFADETTAFITEIIVNRHASVGENVDGKTGDEGLNLMVQPRTADGSVHVVPGELSVDLIDPKASPDQKAIGHWQFLPSETELFFASDRQEGEGILLHLPWEQNLPTRKNLVVSVSFTTPDGRVLSTSSRLRVDPPADDYSPDDPQVAGWTERDKRWEIGTHNQSAKNDPDRWTKSRAQDLRYEGQFAKDEPFDFDNDDSTKGGNSLIRPRVKAIPASSTRPSTQLPSWRPVR